MRWIFLSLLIVNLFVFVWSWINVDKKPAPVQSVSSFSYKKLPKLEMLDPDDLDSERASDAQVSSGSDISKEILPDAISQGKPLCEMVGVFDNLDSARAFSARLEAIDIAHTVHELDVLGGERYWVYLPDDGSKVKVLERLAALQSQGVDSYYIPRGDLANTISLGVFSRESLAEARVREMESKGLSPKIKVKQQTYREIWVVLSPGEHKKMSELTWGRVLGENNSLERRQNFCLDVAS